MISYGIALSWASKWLSFDIETVRFSGVMCVCELYVKHALTKEQCSVLLVRDSSSSYSSSSNSSSIVTNLAQHRGGQFRPQ